MITEEKLRIFKAELCQECPDAPMDECRCGCMRKAICNSLYEHAASEPPTNADRIRSMNDEELARELLAMYLHGQCDCNEENGICITEQSLLDWLRQPVKEELI